MRLETLSGALISAKYTEIQQSEPFAVRLAQATPSGKRPPGTSINVASPYPSLNEKRLPLREPSFITAYQASTSNAIPSIHS